MQFLHFFAANSKKNSCNCDFFRIFAVQMEKESIRIGKELLSLAKPRVMGIVNITPDSFAVSCRQMTDDEILCTMARAVEEGADILDLGGYSSRPGAAEVTTAEEWRRIEQALRIARAHFPKMPLSVDTFRAEIARRAVQDYGVEILNDISGGELDEAMFDTVAETGAAYVLMHMRGTPATMQTLTTYDNMVSDILGYFASRVDRLHRAGVRDVIIDPGFGFSKTTEQNYELLRRMREFKVLGLPILAGLSRKSMIYRPLDIEPASDDALLGTAALNMLALLNGASILRVHDVRAAVNDIKLYSKYISCSESHLA